MISRLENLVDSECVNCHHDHDSDWSSFFNGDTVYKRLVCTNCDYEMLFRVDFLTSGF